MNKFFIAIYNFLNKHKALLYTLLIGSIAIMGYAILSIEFRQNITDFFPSKSNHDVTSEVFQNLNVKDKIIITFTPKEKKSTDTLFQVADELSQTLTQKGSEHISSILLKIDNHIIGGVSNFIYNNLPIFLTDSFYQHLDTLITTENITQRMFQNYQNIISPIGIGSRQYILRDPMGIGLGTLELLQEFEIESGNVMVDNHLFTADTSTLMMILTPKYNMGRIGENEALVSLIEDEIENINAKYCSITTSYFGGAPVSVYNARQIKRDTAITSTLALAIIAIFILLVFKNKRTIVLIVMPALYGMLFALAIIAITKGSISSISMGAGAAIMGIALSYSIHMLAHQNHVVSVTQLINELAYPLTVGSFTTIGAFVALLFTSSALLRDFGLFAALTLIGTTIFCLVFLPHFLKGNAHIKSGRVLKFIEKVNAYKYEKNRWVLGLLLLLCIVSCFTANNVKFNSSMMNMYYEPEHLKTAREKIESFYDTEEKNVIFVSVGHTEQQAIKAYQSTNRQLKELKQQGIITDYASAQQFVVSQQEQQRRIGLWNKFWTNERRQLLEQSLTAELEKYHIKPTAINSFYQWFNKDFKPIDIFDPQSDFAPLITEWQACGNSLQMLITQVRIKEQNKAEVYQQLQENQDLVIFDRAFFTNKWVDNINDDFNWILFASSCLIFIALLISFGRLELTLMSFLPMLISWFIILGLMGLLGIEFNIINIIISTFIFGIGDDFSIFIMDGLQNKYSKGQEILNSHKTAIFCSAFTIVVGMGALIFAQHPALKSISVISIVGMVSVVLVSFTVQPIVFNLLITQPTQKGGYPITIGCIIRSVLVFGSFALAAFVLRVISLLLYIVPISNLAKRQIICTLIHKTCKAVLKFNTATIQHTINPTNNDFSKPTIIISNHQSFIDILTLLALSPRIIIVTNKWVWRSPFFGGLIRYAGFIYTGNGVDENVEIVKQRLGEGFSVAIFPEGTRSIDSTIKRFHKGAFHLAQTLNADITPVVLYGTGNIISKTQPFCIKKGFFAAKILQTIKADDNNFGSTYQERTKLISAYFKKEYALLCDKFNSTDNPTFYYNIINNFIFKGPIVEWYLRVKIKMEHNYQLFNNLIAKEGIITDIGCGLGPLCYMLAQTSPKRDILGIDYDEEKISIAQNGWLRNKYNLRFVHADALDIELRQSDTFILNDMLHYLSHDKQNTLITRCISALKPNGTIIIRDGNAENKERHKVTKFTELLSTRIFKFNKTEEELCFLAESQITDIAVKHNLDIKSIENDKLTSNTIYVLTKKEDITEL